MQNVAVHTTGQKGNENMELIISAIILLIVVIKFLSDD